MTFDWARGRHPELLSGRYYRPLDEAVPHQFFATSMLVSPLLMGTFGWEPDAPHRRARLAPQLPPQWEHTTIRNLGLGETTVDAEFEQGASRFVATLTARGPAITLELAIPIPPGARDVRSSLPGESSTAELYVVSVQLSQTPSRIEIEWTGGLRVEPPTMVLQPGQPSQGLRILDYAYASD